MNFNYLIAIWSCFGVIGCGSKSISAKGPSAKVSKSAPAAMVPLEVITEIRNLPLTDVSMEDGIFIGFSLDNDLSKSSSQSLAVGKNSVDVLPGNHEIKAGVLVADPAHPENFYYAKSSTPIRVSSGKQNLAALTFDDWKLVKKANVFGLVYRDESTPAAGSNVFSVEPFSGAPIRVPGSNANTADSRGSYAVSFFYDDSEKPLTLNLDVVGNDGVRKRFNQKIAPSDKDKWKTAESIFLNGAVPSNPFAADLSMLSGAQGTAGAQGNQGATGSGSQGFQGAVGAQGDIGAQGSQGNQGTAGTGSQGSQGASGSGAQGFQGNSGAQGFQGAAGSGAQGYQGFQGPSGFANNPTFSSTATVKIKLVHSKEGGATSPYTNFGMGFEDGTYGGCAAGASSVSTASLILYIDGNADNDYTTYIDYSTRVVTAKTYAPDVLIQKNTFCLSNGSGESKVVLIEPAGTYTYCNSGKILQLVHYLDTDDDNVIDASEDWWDIATICKP